jgi:hypothetical protein
VRVGHAVMHMQEMVRVLFHVCAAYELFLLRAGGVTLLVL